MKKVVDSMARSTTVRLCAVLGWTVVTAIAYMSRFDRMPMALSILMAAVIASIGACGLVWAVWPSVRFAYRRRRASS